MTFNAAYGHRMTIVRISTFLLQSHLPIVVHVDREEPPAALSDQHVGGSDQGCRTVIELKKARNAA